MQPNKGTSSTAHRLQLFSFTSVSLLYLIARLFKSLSVPFLLGGDQTYFWMDALRLLGGEHIYKDFFRYTTPGTDLFFATIFQFFGAKIWVANAAVAALGISLLLVTFCASRRLMSFTTSLLVAGFFLVFVYARALNATNHWFAILFIALGIQISLSQLSFERLAISGALLACAAFFNQAHGGASLLGFTAFLAWRYVNRRESSRQFAMSVASLTVAFSATLMILLIFFAVDVGPGRLWDCLVIYVFKYPVRHSAGPSWGLPYPSIFSRRNLPYLSIYLLLPITCTFCLWQSWAHRKDPKFPWDAIALLTLTGASLLVEVSVSINWLRLFAISLPGIVLAGWAIHSRLSNRCAEGIVWGILCITAAFQVFKTQTSPSILMDLPAGRAAVPPSVREKLEALQRNTTPGDLFLQAGWTGAYLPLHLRNPLYVATLAFPDATRPGDAERSVLELQTRPVPYILWTANLDLQCPPQRTCDDYLSPVRQYVKNAYTQVQVFSDGDALWKRN
jgi:hypothetical protein